MEEMEIGMGTGMGAVPGPVPLAVAVRTVLFGVGQVEAEVVQVLQDLLQGQLGQFAAGAAQAEGRGAAPVKCAPCSPPPPCGSTPQTDVGQRETCHWHCPGVSPAPRGLEQGVLRMGSSTGSIIQLRHTQGPSGMVCVRCSHPGIKGINPARGAQHPRWLWGALSTPR